MPTASSKVERNVVSALTARTNFGSLLDRVENEQTSVLIEKRGAPRAILMSISDYVKLAAPEPEILKIIGERSERVGTDKLTMREIDAMIRDTRASRKKRR